MAHYNTSQLAMDEVYSWIMNCKNATMNSKIVHCNYAYDAISGALNSGSFLLIGFRNGSYAHITAHSYWGTRAISIGTIENGAWVSRFDRVITNTDFDSVGLPKPKSVTDLYGILNSGFFSYNKDANGNPVPDRGGLGICLYESTAWVVLIVIPYNNTTIYIASKISSAWSNWYKLNPVSTTQ